MFVEWTKEDAKTAELLGWILSQRSDGYWEIQRSDVSNSFESDVQAQAFVKERLQTSSLYDRAWALHATRYQTREYRVKQFLKDSSEYVKHGAVIPVNPETSREMILLLQAARALLSE